MRPNHTSTAWYLTLLTLAALGFGWVFACPLGNFWIKITTTVTILTLLSLKAAGIPWRPHPGLLQECLVGTLAAALLYVIFWLGDYSAAKLFGFAPRQVEAIYAIRQLGHPWLIGAILLTITSPGEELFWRGYIMRQATLRWGPTKGVIIGILAYGAVHIASGNLMLFLAATIAGAFWCLLYHWRGNLTACLVSHSLWTVTVFLILPIR